MKRFSLFFGAMVLLFLLAACGNESKQQDGVTENHDIDKDESNEKLELFTTIFPLEDFTNRIGGEFVHVTNLIPVGSDAHTYEPTAKEMIKAAEGDAFIYNGAGLEGFAESLIDTIKGNVLIVETSKELDLSTSDIHEVDDEDHIEGEHNHHHDVDPHVWLDPILSITIAESIKDALIELKPDETDTFTSNFEQLKADLLALDQQFQDMVSEAKQNTFFVSHAGYGYWEKRYGLKQIGMSGISPTNEPSQRKIQELIEYAQQNDIHYVLIEQNISSKVADVVKNAIGAEYLYIHNLEALVSKDAKNGEDYVSLMEKNIEALRIALNE